jgi:hypothetical protein
LKGWENLLLASASTVVIAGLSVSTPRGRKVSVGIVGDEGGKMTGEGVGVTVDTSIVPCMLMVDEARRSIGSPANCLFLGSETPAHDRQVTVPCYDANIPDLSRVHGDA